MTYQNSRNLKRDLGDQLRLFASEIQAMISSILETETAKTKLYSIEGFSPNLILSLITSTPKEDSFTFEQFKYFISEYLGLQNQVELKSIIDLYSSFKSSLGQKVTKANLARMIVPFERQDVLDSEYPDTESSQQEFEECDKQILKATFLQIFKQRESKTQIKQKIKEVKLELLEIFQSLAKNQADKRVGSQEFSEMLTENLG